MAAPVITCYRHPERSAGVTCQRCDRPICPTCMTQASVGFQCPECVKESAKNAPVYTARTLPKGQPIVTWVLIAVNAVVFVADLATGGTPMAGQGQVWEQGVLWGPYIADGEWWRLFSAGFLHYGLLHIGMNMYVLWRIGPQLESLLGRLNYFSLYIASLLAGSLGALLLSPNAATAGASGAIFGLLGAAAAYQYVNHINMWQSGLAMLIGLNLLITFTLPVSKGGHLGGIIGGAACGFVMFRLEAQGKPRWFGAAVAGGLGLMCIVVSVALAPALSRSFS